MTELGVFDHIATINPRSPSAAFGEPVSFVAMADVSEQGRLNSVEVRNGASGYTPFTENDVLVAKITPCLENGKGAHARHLPVPLGQGSTEFHVLRARLGTSSRYLYHLTRTDRFRLEAEALMTGSAGQRRVPAEFFRRYEIRVPPLEEQRRIAEILDTIDETIQATERVITKLAVAQSGFIDRSLYRSESVPTELADACWGPGEYGCVGTASKYRVGWPRYVRITDLTRSGGLRNGSEVSVSPSVARNYTLHTGDIVFARSGATVGKTYLYDPSDGPCAFAGYLIRFRPDPKKALPEYVRWWTHSSSYWQWVRRTMREGAQPNINAQEYAKAILPLPSVEEQRLIVESIARFDVAIKSERTRRIKLQQVRSGLAADLLSGRVRTVAA